MSTRLPFPEKESNQGILQTAPIPQTSSPLLNLPGELRNRIYEFVFSDSYHVPLVPSHWPEGADVRPTKYSKQNAGHGLALLQTCREVYREAHLLPFTCGTLIVGDPTAHGKLELQGLEYAPCDPRVHLPLHAEQAITNLEVHFSWNMFWAVYTCPEHWWDTEHDDLSAIDCWLALPTLKSLATLHILLHTYPDDMVEDDPVAHSPEANWELIKKDFSLPGSTIWVWAEMVADAARMHEREVDVTVDFGADFAPGYIIVEL